MLIAFLTALALQAAAPAPVPPRAAPPSRDDGVSGEVIVRGRKDPTREVRRFVRGFAELEGSDPLARFSKSAICPGVAGIGAAQAEAIAARMRRVATAAGLEVDGRGCRPNVLVILAPDRAAMLAWLRRERPNMFESRRREPVDVRDDGRASVAWQVLGLVDRWGAPIPGSSSEYAVASLPDGASRLNSPVRPVVQFSAIVIDAAAIDGLTVTQLADHALMRTVAGADPRRLGESTAPSVARLLETPIGGEAPPTLTDWDFSYLKALYAVPENYYGQRQRSAIRARMRKDREAAARSD